MVLLVHDRQGYLNLCELLARAWTRNDGRGQAVVQREWLEELNAGLAATWAQRWAFSCAAPSFSCGLGSSCSGFWLGLDFGDFGSYFGDHEEVEIVWTRDKLNSLIGQFNLIIFLLNYELKFGINFWHLPIVILHIVVFVFLKDLFNSFFR